MKENLLVIILSLIIIAISLVSYLLRPPLLVFLNVGQGDSMLYSYKNTQIVVDGGPGNYLEGTISKYIPFYDREIELMILTHAHLDHYAGLGDILKTFQVKRIVLPVSTCKPDEVYTKFLELVEREGAIVEELSEVSFGELNISFLHVNKLSCTRSSLETNNSSLVTTFEYNGIKVLNMGDLEEEMEFKVSVSGVDILKAGHHCSKTSSSEGFVESIKPLVSICSLGENNSYGHPSSEVLDRFKRNNTDVFITKDIGDILVNLKERLIYNQDGKLLKKL